MTETTRWQIVERECPEEQRTARLILGWGTEEGKEFLKSIHCDHPGLRETDNWDCDWSCIEGVARVEEV